MKVLVTGAGGFIGASITRRLLGRGDEVRGLLMEAEPDRGLQALGMEVWRGDLTAPSTIAGAAEGCDNVIHTANRTIDWGTKRQFFSIGVDGTRNLLEESAGKINRFVYFSSIAAYGFGPHAKGFEEDRELVKTGIHYGDAKVEAEKLTRSYGEKGALDFTIIRPSNVTGPRSVWVTDILDFMNKGLFPLFDGGKYSASLVYVENLVDGIIMAMDSEVARGKAYNFRDDYEITWKEYAQGLGKLVGKKPRGSLPFKVGWYAGKGCHAVFAPLGIRPPVTPLAVAVLGRDNDVSNARAKEDLGWKTRVPWDEAWAAIEKWVREEYKNPKQRKSAGH